MALNFLFWNIKAKEELLPLICEIVDEHNIDIIILCECKHEVNKALRMLNTNRESMFHYFASINDKPKLELYTRFSTQFISHIFDDPNNNLSIVHIDLPERLDFLLCMIHLPSKMHNTPSGQLIDAIEAADEIRNAEKRLNIERTLVVGDFNMNPFEDGMVNTKGFHAVMTQAIALKSSRSVRNEEYPFFYNPMWGNFGDLYPEPSGTYYYPKSGHLTYFWNIFDQVLVRPELIPYFDNKNLKVLTSVNSISLLDHNEIPNDTEFSDHLPLIFTIEI